MSEIQECYWLTPLVKTEYSRKWFGIITPCTKVAVKSPLFAKDDSDVIASKDLMQI
jgi:hypothetical protein